jgi:3-hydroxyisobutyrate dehydrogenase-like beta-hydroxyacid dehydrogenase
MKVGVVGLGSMGTAIAKNLIKAGHEVTVYNRTKSKAKALVKEGAKLAETLADAAQGDAVLTMVADDHALLALVLGFPESPGFMHKQSKHCTHISMSTVSAQAIKGLEQRYEERGLPMLSAPVMGRPDVAERGELVIMTAGDAALIEKMKPIFDAIGKKLHILGSSPHQANVAKLAANFMISSMIETFGEALALVRKAGVDPHQFYDLAANDFFKSPIYQKYGKIIVDGNFDNGAFTVKLQAKDTRLALQSAEELSCPMPFASVVNNTFINAIARGRGDKDPCVITQIIAENAGL